MKKLMAAVCLVASAVASAAVGNPSGSVPSGLPARLSVGLNESGGNPWMKNSGAPWDSRYIYLTKGWVDNWGWGAADGSYALSYMNESKAQGVLPTFSFYQFNLEPGGYEAQFMLKTQNAATMRSYFGDFKILMQRAKDFGSPVLVLIEPDGTALLEQQTHDNASTYAAIAASGMPELASLPNTTAGWGQAFVKLRDAVGANNVMLGLHVSGWGTGYELFHNSVTMALQPLVDQGYAFLQQLGLAQYDVLVADPLDRDADYYRLVQGSNAWWNTSDTAALNTASFNRYAEWLRLWNVKSNKRWVLWQIPEGNASQSNVCRTSAQGSGYKDNRSEYFFGASGAAHREKFATVGVAALLFGAGEGCQATHETDNNYLKTNAGAFLRAGGLAIPRGSGGTTPPPPPPNPTFASTVTVSGTTLTANVTGGTPGFVLVEVHDAANATVASKSCTAVTTCALTFSTTVAGTYVVKVGIFDISWNLLNWNDTAASLTVSAAPVVRYDFEGTTQGWNGTVSPARAFSGTRSLAVSVTASALTVSVANPPIAAGKKVTFRLYVPAGARLTSVQPYVLENNTWRYTGAWVAGSSLTVGAWNTLSVTVPAGAQPLASLGLELGSANGWRGTVYLDGVTD